MPIGSHPLGFGAVQGSGTRVSSPLATSFGFGANPGPLTPSTNSPYPHHWASPHHHPTSPHPNPFAHAFARTESHATSSRPQVQQHEMTTSHTKRRRSPSDDEAMMERGSVSPTPTTGRTMKRLRQGREVAESSERRDEQSVQGQADLGVLLASLPSSTHLQILHSLIASHPELKPVIHALIPPPEVSFAIQVLDEKLERLIEAVPIGAHPSSSAPASSRPIGASFGFGSSRPTTNGTVSDGYLLNRLRMPLTEFTNVALTYLPYFIAPRQTDKAPTHPSTSFQYLSHLTNIIITRILPIMPPSTSATLAPLTTLLTALQNAWETWLAQISEHVNAHAGMYAASMAESWIQGIESLAAQAERLARPTSTAIASGSTTAGTGSQGRGAAENLARGMRHLAREWVRQVGWLIGRSVGGGDEGMGDRMDE